MPCCVSVSAHEVQVMPSGLGAGHLSDDRFWLCAWSVSGPFKHQGWAAWQVPPRLCSHRGRGAASFYSHTGGQTPPTGASHRKPCLFKEKRKRLKKKIPDRSRDLVA